MLAPVDGPRAEVRAHVSYDQLVVWHFVEREVMELEALDCLVAVVVEIARIWVKVPFRGIYCSAVANVLIVGYLCRVAEFLRLLDSGLRPAACREIVCCLALL